MSERDRVVVCSATLVGLAAQPVRIETERAEGTRVRIEGLEEGPARSLEGLVTHAAGSCGLRLSGVRCRVRTGDAACTDPSGLGLAVAACCLAACGVVTAAELECCLVVGNLDERGHVGRVPGMVSHIELARRLALTLVTGRGSGPLPVPWSCVRLIETLDELTGSLRPAPLGACAAPVKGTRVADFSELSGLEAAKRALVVAVCGTHPLLLFGLDAGEVRAVARRCASVLPPLGPRGRREVERIRSVAGLDAHEAKTGARPVRVCDATSPDALFGDGGSARLGEVTLAHGGVLVLEHADEMADGAAEELAGMCSSGVATCAGSEPRVVFPARFLLVCCVGKGPGPARGRVPARLASLLDVVCGRDADAGAPAVASLGSHEMAERILAGLVFRARRRRKAWEDAGSCAQTGGGDEPEQECADDTSGRYGHAVGRVARTLADLEGCLSVHERHLRKASGLVSGGDG